MCNPEPSEKKMEEAELNRAMARTIEELKFHWRRFKAREEKETDAVVFADYDMMSEHVYETIDGQQVEYVRWTFAWDDPCQEMRFFVTPDDKCYKAECWHSEWHGEPRRRSGVQDEVFFLEVSGYFLADRELNISRKARALKTDA